MRYHTTPTRLERTNWNAWFIQLRWIACAVSVIFVVAAIRLFHYLPPKLLVPLLVLIGVLALTNVLYSIVNQRYPSFRWIAEAQIVSDLLLLTAMLHYSGGIENPMSLAYLFHVILSGILLSRRKAFAVALLSFGLYSAMAVAELTGAVEHYTLGIFPHEIEETSLPSEEMTEDHSPSSAGDEGPRRVDESSGPASLPVASGHPAGRIHASHSPVFVASMCTLSLFLMFLTAYFITTIMERLRSEERRSQLERQRLERVLDATGAGLLVLDNQLKPVWHNAQVSRWLSTDESKSEQSMRLPWSGSAGQAVKGTLSDGAIRSVEHERILPTGARQYFQLTIAPLSDPEGATHQIVELIQDVTDKKVIEAEMLHTAKMAALGTMAAGVAHEVGNPLASIATRLQLLESERNDDFISASLPLLRREISRIERILYGISHFGQAQQTKWGLVDLNEITGETIELLRYNRLAKTTRIETQLDPTLPSAVGVRDQLKQILLNLGLNALEAMPSGGVIVFRTYVEAGEVRVSVSDDGPGIDPARKEKLFQPFVTSKDTGSGLGLFIVHHLVQAHGGSVTAESAVGKGTTIVVGFPLRDERTRPDGARRT